MALGVYETPNSIKIIVVTITAIVDNKYIFCDD